MTATEAIEIERADRRRFPLEPLLEHLARNGISNNTVHRRAQVHMTRALKAGTVNGDQADRLAGLLGKHPYEIWGEQWYQETA